MNQMKQKNDEESLLAQLDACHQQFAIYQNVMEKAKAAIVAKNETIQNLSNSLQQSALMLQKLTEQNHAKDVQLQIFQQKVQVLDKKMLLMNNCLNEIAKLEEGKERVNSD